MGKVAQKGSRSEGARLRRGVAGVIAFLSEVGTGLRENASKQESGASVLIQSEPKLQA
jgi:hypothetical protein